MKPDEFYRNSDLPTPKAQERMWNTIENEISEKQNGKSIFFLHKRSFIYGAAASIILMLATYGMYSGIERSLANSRPDDIKFDVAYRSAIKELEKVVPAVEKTVVNTQNADILETRKEQIAMLDTEISVLQRDSKRGDLSGLKQAKLRQLYRQKLSILQEMIENGEIPL
ncbi:MAG: hypothetical protein HYZ54_08925 [Ignavibacteriae bacterium]|nr:hypothetical protein [Ignavibacteriota bacterium]